MSAPNANAVIAQRLIIGDAVAAGDKSFLKKVGVTHIVNASTEVPNFFPREFTYIKLNLNDDLTEHIKTALESSFTFIDSALRNPRAVVYVHCYAGISRSASVVLYYLMRKYRMSYDSAFRALSNARSVVNPNANYVRQLKAMDSRMPLDLTYQGSLRRH
jgi:protein-tyrosine phosphatase